jgi:hypothetical protein
MVARRRNSGTAANQPIKVGKFGSTLSEVLLPAGSTIKSAFTAAGITIQSDESVLTLNGERVDAGSVAVPGETYYSTRKYVSQ